VQRTLKVLLTLNVVMLVWNLTSTVNAQRPAQTSEDGVPYLKVNINPTDVPPLVNINPHQFVPKVEVTQMPAMQMPAIMRVAVNPAGCNNRQNFMTGAGRTISGPMVLTYLNAPPQTQGILSNSQGGNQRLTLSTATQLGSAIYLSAGQSFTFDADVIYSGCRPE
jgi:hypothetical protein